jgi:hypothetical protein
MSQSTHEFIDRYVLPTLGFIALIVVWLTA